MAVSPSPSVTLTPPKPESNETPPLINPQPVPPDPNPPSIPFNNPQFPSFTPPPSFRPIINTPYFPHPPQFTPINPQNPNFQVQVQPPGVTGSVTVSLRPPGSGGVTYYQNNPNMMPMQYAGGQVPPIGYSNMQGPIPPPRIPRYLSTYMPMVRPAYPPRMPGAIGMLQPLVCPPIPGIRGVSPVAPPVVRPVVPIVAPTEKPQTKVYVGKIASTVENDFILTLLRLCGPVKSWKHAQDPSNGAPRGFGFCEFESAEGLLRALRMRSKFNVDGQELVLNVTLATRKYLERYVEKKTEREKLKETEAEGSKKGEESAPGVEKNEPPKPPVEDTKENVPENKETADNSENFGVVTDEDREADREALEKFRSMLEERLKTKPLPPPPTLPPPEGFVKSNSEVPTKSRDGDSDVDIMRSGDDKNDDEMTSEDRPSIEQDWPETSSPDRNRKNDRRSRERDEKREKERELERYEREREMKSREADCLYKERLKTWECRELERACSRRSEREREKERVWERKREIMDQEDERDDDRKRRRRSSVKWQREKEEDIADRLREEAEIAEAKKRELEQQKEEAKHLTRQLSNGDEKSALLEEATADFRSSAVAEQSYESVSGVTNHSDDLIMKNGVGDDSTVLPVSLPDTRQSSNAPTKKLGFGLVGSGKRTAVPSVFHEEDEDDGDKDKKMRPLVPIDYSTEELQAVQTPSSRTPPHNLAAAAEFAKRISNVNPKEERNEAERDRSRRASDRSSQRERDRNDEARHRPRDDYKEKTTDRDRERERVKTQENKKLLDAKQLIDMIPKTKEELFSYEINWAVYDKHELHERMRPWISKKITEFLDEEEVTLVEYIVSKTKEHVRASEMLEQLQVIMDDEAEMFVLKMWRMLIFEIKKVETGLPLKPKA